MLYYFKTVVHSDTHTYEQFLKLTVGLGFVFFSFEQRFFGNENVPVVRMSRLILALQHENGDVTPYRRVIPSQKALNLGLLFTFRMTRIDDTKCIVVIRVCVSVCLCVYLCVCPRPHAYTNARTRM